MATPENGSFKPLETWKIVAIVLVAIIVIYMAFVSNPLRSKPEKKLTVEQQRQNASDELTSKYAVTPPWYPSDFNEYAENADIAWRWLKPKEFTCTLGDYCFGIIVIAKYGCSSNLYAEVSIADKSDTQVAYSNDTLSMARPMQKNKLVFSTYEPNAQTAYLSKISCR